MVTQSFPKTWLRQDKSLNPTGVLNPATGQPYVYADGKAPVVPAESSFLSSNNNSEVVTPSEKPVVTRSKYINPATGKFFTPEEYGNYVATKIPVASDVPKYAGDAMTDPNQSATNLEGIARNLNNARNDIATGTTDPYGVGNKSGIAYSPNELKAIEKAYAGVYDPALNDVFARLKEKQTSDKKIQDREDQIFATNENIRQWKATTGSKNSGNGNAADLFTQTQLNTGARNAGMTIEGFSQLDEDLINYFVIPPKGYDDVTQKTGTVHSFFMQDIADVKAGKKKVADVAADIEGSELPEAVKHYYIDQLPLSDVEKKGFWSRIWGAVTNT